jgi:cytochrome P450
MSSSLSLIALLMALHPHIQEKIFKELQTVFGSVHEEVTDDHLKQLTYLDLVIKETLRFWSPVPFIARRVGQDMELGRLRLVCFTLTNNLRDSQHRWLHNSERHKYLYSYHSRPSKQSFVG